MTLLHLLRHLCGLFRINGFSSFFNERNNVAHAEDSVGDPFRVEVFQRVGFFTGTDQFDGFAGDRLHGKRCTAASVTVHSGQRDTGDANTFVKAAGQIDRVLSGQ